MIKNANALAIATVIAQIAELDGDEAAQKASFDPVAFRAGLRRVVAAKTAAAIKFSDGAQLAAKEIRRATDLDAAFRAYAKVTEPASEAGVAAEIVKEIARLDDAAFAEEVARVEEADNAAADACTIALFNLDLDPGSHKELLDRVITMCQHSSPSKH